jgi:3-phenylpropionate/cinnamic acid dioxygenase small subunit
MRNSTTYADVVAGVCAAIAAYAQALDDGRVDDVVATFCADGSCDIPGLGAHAGRDALRLAFETVKPRAPQRHVVVNTHVTEWDEHNAKATSDLIFLLKGDAGWTVQLVGRYDDTLRNDDGTWRFARRVAEFVH